MNRQRLRGVSRVCFFLSQKLAFVSKCKGLGGGAGGGGAWQQHLGSRTRLFIKSRMCWGEFEMQEAKQSMEKEGYLDLLRCDARIRPSLLCSKEAPH